MSSIYDRSDLLEAIQRLTQAGSPPSDGPYVCGLHGAHGGPLVRMEFHYEDGTVWRIGPHWYTTLQRAVAEEA